MPTEQSRTPLQKIIERGKPLSPEVSIRICSDLCALVQQAHSNAQVFGALYPDQVLISRDDVQILELAAERVPEDLTLLYLSFVPPEKLDGSPITHQSDLYSIGVVLYSCLSGKTPFDAVSNEDLTEQILNTRMIELPQFNGPWTELDWIIQKCMLRVPARRFKSADELGQELRKLTKGRSAPKQTAAVAAEADKALPSAVSFRRKQQKSNFQDLLLKYWKFLVPGVLLLLAIVIFLLVYEPPRPVRIVEKWSVRPITQEREMETDPAYSPAGDILAYTSNATGNWDLYLLKSGQAPVQLTQSPGREENPRWSPSGDLILYTYYGIEEPPTLFAVSPAGGIPQRIAGDATDGQWSPDGKRICFVSPAAADIRNLTVLDLDQNKTSAVLSGAKISHPSFSPDGLQLVYATDKGLSTAEIATGKAKQLTTNHGDAAPTWDSERGLIFYVARKGKNSEIFTVTPDGKTTQATSGQMDFRPAPAKNGEVVFYRQTRVEDIVRFDVETGTPRIISPNIGRSGIPRSAGENAMIYLDGDGQIKIVGSERADPKSADGGAGRFSVSPDGTRVILESPEGGLKQVYILSGASDILEAGLVLPYEVSADRKWLFGARRAGENVVYFRRELKSGAEENLFQLAYENRILRAAWLDNDRIAFLTPDYRASSWSIKDKTTTPFLTELCFDFAFRHGANQMAAITGPSLTQAKLVLIDSRGNQKVLTSFNREEFSEHVDWVRGMNVLLYDRIRPGADVFVMTPG